MVRAVQPALARDQVLGGVFYLGSELVNVQSWLAVGCRRGSNIP